MWDKKNTLELAHKLVLWRRMFHSNPELSYEEKETSIAIFDALTSMGIEVHKFNDHFGLCGIIRGKYPGPGSQLFARTYHSGSPYSLRHNQYGRIFS